MTYQSNGPDDASQFEEHAALPLSIESPNAVTLEGNSPGVGPVFCRLQVSDAPTTVEGYTNEWFDGF